MINKVIGELTVFVEDETENENESVVSIQDTALGFKYEIYISSVDTAITELQQIVDWLKSI